MGAIADNAAGRSLTGIVFRCGYFTGWLTNRTGMPLDISIGDQLIIGGTVIGVLLAVNFFL